MGFIFRLLLPFLAALLSCSTRRVYGQCEGDFSLSCSDSQLVGPSTLQASCGNGQGGSLTTQLDLDAHIVNNNGNLECNSGGGGFSASCQSASIAASNVLEADCFDVSGNLLQASVDLDECVQNSSGTLEWACVS